MIAALAGDLALVPWARPWRPASGRAAGDWRNALGPVPLEELRDLVLGQAWREHQGPGCPGAVTIGTKRPLKAGALDGTLVRVPDTPANRACFGTVGTSDDSGPYPCLRALPLTCCSCRALFAMPHGPAGTDKAGSEQALLDEAMACFPVLFAPGWIWLMDRNYHGAPRIARMIQCTHVLIRLKSDIPLKRASEILPDGSYRAELSGDGVTVKVRVIEYWVTVEGQEVPEMFCLVTDLMDWEDYPAPELAALYRWRWDGSETALREAKAVLRGAGPGTGPMLRSGTPDLVRQDRGLGRRYWDDPPGRPRRRRRRRARAQGAPCRAHGPAPGPVLRPRSPGCPVRDPPRARLLPDRDQRNRALPGRRRQGPAPRPEVQVPLVLRARGTGGHRHPHRPRHHYHGQRPGLTSTNSGHRPSKDPSRTVDPAARRDTPPSACPLEGTTQ